MTPKKPFTPNDPRHGTVNGYSNLDCRCEKCTEAWRIHHYNYMHRDPQRLADHAERERLRRRKAKEKS